MSHLQFGGILPTNGRCTRCLGKAHMMSRPCLCWPVRRHLDCVSPASSDQLHRPYFANSCRCLLSYFSRQSPSERAHTRVVFQRDHETFNSMWDCLILEKLLTRHLVKHYFLVHLWDVSEEISIWFSGLNQGHPCQCGQSSASLLRTGKGQKGRGRADSLSPLKWDICLLLSSDIRPPDSNWILPDFPDLKLADSRSWHLSASINVWVICYNKSSLTSIYLSYWFCFSGNSEDTSCINIFSTGRHLKIDHIPSPHMPASHNKW